MRTFYHSIALIKTRRPSSASASSSLTTYSSFHISSQLLDRGACDSCPVRDSCKGRKEGEAQPKPEGKQGNGADKEVVDDVAGPCTVKNAGPLYESLKVGEAKDDQGTASTGEREKQGAEGTSAMNQQRLQDLDKRIKALSPGFWGGREPQDIGLRMILQKKRDALLREDVGKERPATGLSGPATATQPTVSTSSSTTPTWPEERISRARQPERQLIAEHERRVEELRAIETRLEALNPAYEAREDEFGGVRGMLEKQREELRREVEWFEGLDWVERGRGR